MIVDWPMALAVAMVCGVFYLAFLVNAGRRRWRRMMRDNADLVPAPAVVYEITSASQIINEPRAILSGKSPGDG